MMKRKRNSKFQYGIKSHSNNVVNGISIFDKNIDNKDIDNKDIDNKDSLLFNEKNSNSKKNKIKEFLSFLLLLMILYIFELCFIAIFNDNEHGVIYDFQFLLTFIALGLTPIWLWQNIMNKDSHEIKKKKFELCDFIFDSVLIVIVGYLIGYSEMVEKTKMAKTILTSSKNLLEMIIILITPIKIYFSIQLFRYSRKENAKGKNNPN